MRGLRLVAILLGVVFLFVGLKIWSSESDAWGLLLAFGLPIAVIGGAFIIKPKSHDRTPAP